MQKEDIAHLAKLARLRLSDEDTERYLKDFDSILGYVDAVTEIGAGDAAPSVGAFGNVLRNDVETHEPALYTDALLSAAPEREGHYVKVKKILDQKKDA